MSSWSSSSSLVLLFLLLLLLQDEERLRSALTATAICSIALHSVFSLSLSHTLSLFLSHSSPWFQSRAAAARIDAIQRSFFAGWEARKQGSKEARMPRLLSSCIIRALRCWYHVMLLTLFRSPRKPTTPSTTSEKTFNRIRRRFPGCFLRLPRRAKFSALFFDTQNTGGKIDAALLESRRKPPLRTSCTLNTVKSHNCGRNL